MPVFIQNAYARWRVETGAAPLLNDDATSPPESLLQSIWLHQRVFRDKLRTSDGRTVQVLHPGFQSFAGGPDFREAVIQFESDAPRSGDVEVDIRCSGWRSHGHAVNPAFRNVILQVVWDDETAPGNNPPVLCLRQVLDATPGELSFYLGSETRGALPAKLRGKCCAPLARLDSTYVERLLQQAAQVRLQTKASQFHARARQAGWEQSLWEGLFRALGYKNNIWPMQRIGELRPRWYKPGADLISMQARLLGIGGLLPSDVSVAQLRSDPYIREVWDCWWRERDEFSECLLPSRFWRLHGLRPVNNPERRLALAAHWAAGRDLPREFEKWCLATLTRSEFVPSLAEILAVPDDVFWSWHWNFRAARLKKPQPLLGEARMTDLAINVVLPWLWIRASDGSHDSLMQRIEERYFTWPCGQDNSVLKLARERLLGGQGSSLRGAAAQQGLLQVVRDYCERSNAICEGCKMPELVERWVQDSPASMQQGSG